MIIADCVWCVDYSQGLLRSLIVYGVQLTAKIHDDP